MSNESKTHIESMKDLCDYFHADEPAMLNKRIYDGTNCGASISVLVPAAFLEADGTQAKLWIHNDDQAWRYLTTNTTIVGFTIQTIVEGSDATVDSDTFVLPVEKSTIEWWMQFMEDEARLLWDEANLEEEELA